ncbi:MAG TPA: alpha/beta fold hydrolase [Candidatus Kapabacteria bacterium]|nr:alpha/beta fold hydrolase [Candidatus Kapabacteria bacterium]
MKPIFLLTISLLTFTGCSVEFHEAQLLNPSRATVLSADSLSYESLTGENLSVEMEPGVTLRGILLQNPSGKRSILYFYGNGGKLVRWELRKNLDSLALVLDANIICFDYRGYGFSDGDALLTALPPDGLKVYDTARAKWSSDKPLYVYGYSIGAAPATFIASQRKCAGLILQSPPTTAAAIIPGWVHFLPWYQRLVISFRADSALAHLKPQPLDLASQIHVPTLIIVGTDDDLIPPKFSRQLFDSIGTSNKTFVEVPGADHYNLAPYRPPTVDSLRHFMDRN